MDFKVTVMEDGDDSFKEWGTFDQYNDALDYMNRKMAEWNNFSSGEILVFKLEKVASDTPTLGVSVDDKLDIADLFGRQ